MMDIESLEKLLGDGSPHDDNTASEVMLYIACHLLRLIYRKLEDIDGNLGSIYSQLNAMEQSLPSKW